MINPNKVTLIAMLACTVVLSACGNTQGDPEGGAEAAAASEVVAHVGDVSITMADLETRAQARLRKLEQDRYNVLREVLEGMAVEQVVTAKAEELGMSVPELLAAEVTNKVQQPTENEIADYYEAHRKEAGSRTLEDLRERIAQMLITDSTEQRRREFLETLKSETMFSVYLDPPRTDVAIPQSVPTRGDENAAVTIIEFGDFQCPYCRRAHPTLERLLTEFQEDVRYVFQDYPLSKHERAVPASRAARCAGEQDKYWEYFQHLMVMTGDLSDDDLQGRAQQLKLDMTTFTECYSSDRHMAELQETIKNAENVGVGKTPTFFINGRMVEGAKPYDELRTVIEEEIGMSRRSASNQDG